MCLAIQADLKAEGAALANRAITPSGAHFYESFRDSQSESGSAKFTCGRAIGVKRFKNDRLLILSDADAGVFYRKLNGNVLSRSSSTIRKTM